MSRLGPPGVHRSAASVEELGWSAEGELYVVPPVTSKAELLDALAAALRFPPWFGRNWDALADLLADLSWLPEAEPVLVWSDSAALAAADPEAYRIAVEILAGAGTRRGLVTLLADG